MIIRPCTAADAEAIDALYQEFVNDLRSIGDQTDYRFGAAQYLTDGFGIDPMFRGFVADEDGALLGYTLFSRTYDGSYERGLYIVDLFVTGRSRRRGIGERLVEAVRQAARAEGAVRLSWHVHRLNADAIRFYKRLGATHDPDALMLHLDA